MSGYKKNDVDILTDYAKLASPALSGTPTAPTAVNTDNSTQIATTAFVKSIGYITSSATTATTQLATDNSTAIATTAFVKNQGYITASYNNLQGITIGPYSLTTGWSGWYQLPTDGMWMYYATATYSDNQTYGSGGIGYFHFWSGGIRGGGNIRSNHNTFWTGGTINTEIDNYRQVRFWVSGWTGQHGNYYIKLIKVV